MEKLYTERCNLLKTQMKKQMRIEELEEKLAENAEYVELLKTKGEIELINRSLQRLDDQQIQEFIKE